MSATDGEWALDVLRRVLGECYVSLPMTVVDNEWVPAHYDLLIIDGSINWSRDDDDRLDRLFPDEEEA